MCSVSDTFSLFQTYSIATQEISKDTQDDALSYTNSIVALMLSVILAPALAIVLQVILSSNNTNTIHYNHETRNSSSLHYQRRLQHILTGILFYILSYIISRPIAMTLLCISSITFYILHRARSSSTKVQQHFLDFFGPLLRDYEKKIHNLPGAFWFLLGCTIVVCCFPMNIARTSILCLALGDPMAAVVGIHVGGPNIAYSYSSSSSNSGKSSSQKKVGSKSISGCMACFTTCSLVAMICMNQYGPKLWFLTGFTATAMESFESLCPWFAIDDNLLIPVGTGVVLWLYTTC